eukprot:CAMPEP_0171303484 /NCGR_PEP_ID=MMETSP0816-20121228/13005_1 /TAXON_ID=420281 /ORGANISM="Proboscia inermis, Strain CCAP1064/1" /LENGTH=70 /DNA_ID=CAMNT_0011782759 /DNA_START=500 /DNA_END=712 /DNA_ORIENTATION=-
MTSSAYCHCGIYPFNLECDRWTMVLDSLGKLNKELNLDRKEKCENKFEIVVNKRADITFDEEEIFTEDFP